MADVIVKSAHCRALGYCLIPGVRDFCARNNLSFEIFIKNGFPSSVLLATNDAMAIKVVNYAIGVTDNGR